MINQQEILQKWIDDTIKKAPHIKQVVEDAVENKELFIDEEGKINVSSDYIKKVVPMTWFTSELWYSLTEEEREKRIQEIKMKLKEENGKL